MKTPLIVLLSLLLTNYCLVLAVDETPKQILEER